MMAVRPGLLKMLWRQALPATLVGTLGLSAYVILCAEVLTSRDPWVGLLVLAQCLLMGALLGQFRSPTFAFIYSRGYSRDSLWAHVMLASALSVLAGCLPAMLIMWTGLRSLVHDRLLHSPYFPIMAPRETWVPLTWVVLYLLLVPACHYAWIRRAQPTKGRHGGSLVTVGLIAALVVAFDMVRYLDGWFAWLSGALYVGIVVCLIVGGRVLHRSLEVRA